MRPGLRFPSARIQCQNLSHQCSRDALRAKKMRMRDAPLDAGHRASRATMQTRFLAATLRDGAILSHFVVARSLFGMTKRRRSRLKLAQNRRRRTRDH